MNAHAAAAAANSKMIDENPEKGKALFLMAKFMMILKINFKITRIPTALSIAYRSYLYIYIFGHLVEVE